MKKFGFLAVIAAVMISAGYLSDGVLFAKATSTREQINQAEKEKQKLENKLDETNDDINGLKKEQKTLKSELKSLNTEMEEISSNLADLESQIAVKLEEIEITENDLKAARETEKWQYEWMVIRIREMYEMNDNNAIVNAIIKAGSFSQMVSTADYLEMIEAYDQRKFAEYKETRKVIESEEARLNEEHNELEALKEAAENERNKISSLIAKTSDSIADYADQISDAQKQAEEYEAAIKKQEENLDYLKKKLAEEIAMSQRAAKAAWRDISEITFAEDDRYLLANLIYCEAGGEPYEGKLAVGAVVVNRVLSSLYPDTVVGVIYQNKQFSPAGSGRLALALAENRATAACYQAADEAMSGVTNVGTCLYFRTPIPGLTGISIGGHIFY